MAAWPAACIISYQYLAWRKQQKIIPSGIESVIHQPMTSANAAVVMAKW